MTKPVADKVYKDIKVNIDDFTVSRNALIAHLHQLNTAVQYTLEAYVNHSEAVLGGKLPLDGRKLHAIIDTAMKANPALAAAGLGAAADGEPTKRKRRKREPRAEGLPKRPETAYFQYQRAMREHFRERYPAHSKGQIANELTSAWNALNEEAQKPYKEAYLRERAQYQQDLAAWKILNPHLAGPKSKAIDAQDPSALPNTSVDDDASSEDTTSDESDDEDAPLPPPAAKAKGKGGRPRKNPEGSSPAKAASAVPIAPALLESPAKITKKRKAKGAEEDGGPVVKEKKSRKKKTPAPEDHLAV